MYYNTTDLTIIIPTKDRPEEINRHLISLLKQDCDLGRIIVVASGKNINKNVMSFKGQLPVEYYHSKPGQIRQRNLGISKLDNRTKLVATMDDDVTYEKDAIKNMIEFWNNSDNNTAGVGFNIINISSGKHSSLRGILGFSSKYPGKVLKSGFCTSISNVKNNCQVEWLNGGATIWKKEILFDNPHEELAINWAVGEDLIFSYPLSKKHLLYISSNAKVKIDEEILNIQENKFYFDRGKSIYVMGLYFVLKNKDLSSYSFIINKLLYVIVLLVKGIIYLDKTKFYLANGFLKSFVKNFRILLKSLFNKNLNIDFSNIRF